MLVGDGGAPGVGRIRAPGKAQYQGHKSMPWRSHLCRWPTFTRVPSPARTAATAEAGTFSHQDWHSGRRKISSASTLPVPAVHQVGLVVRASPPDTEPSKRRGYGG